MKTLHGMPVWAPTEAELRAIDKRVRAERAQAAKGAVAYIARKVADVFLADRAADKVHLKQART
ncbi:MAG: hypothetical protein ACR2OV_14660 [Hyphomicrobiaceae bacterium]